jgi:hypothetical protein
MNYHRMKKPRPKDFNAIDDIIVKLEEIKTRKSFLFSDDFKYIVGFLLFWIPNSNKFLEKSVKRFRC